jgi:hypothetical protein
VISWEYPKFAEYSKRLPNFAPPFIILRIRGMCEIAQTRFWSWTSLGETRKGTPCPCIHPGDWKHVAEQASEEMNSDRLMELVNELNRVLGEHEETCRQQRHQGD